MNLFSHLAWLSLAYAPFHFPSPCTAFLLFGIRPTVPIILLPEGTGNDFNGRACHGTADDWFHKLLSGGALVSSPFLRQRRLAGATIWRQYRALGANHHASAYFAGCATASFAAAWRRSRPHLRAPGNAIFVFALPVALLNVCYSTLNLWTFGFLLLFSPAHSSTHTLTLILYFRLFWRPRSRRRLLPLEQPLLGSYILHCIFSYRH